MAQPLPSVCCRTGPAPAGACARHDQVAHLGQDEFAIFSEHIDDSAGHAARRVLQRVGIELKIDGERFALSASVGVSQFPADGEDAETFAAAGARKPRRRRGAPVAPRGRVIMPSTPRPAGARSTGKRPAPGAGPPGRNASALSAHHQFSHWPSGVHGSRWRAGGIPRLGMVSPERFIPIAEESSLIIALGHRLLDTALAQWQAGVRPVCPAAPVSVNLSGRQLCKPGSGG